MLNDEDFRDLDRRVGRSRYSQGKLSLAEVMDAFFLINELKDRYANSVKRAEKSETELVELKDRLEDERLEHETLD